MAIESFRKLSQRLGQYQSVYRARVYGSTLLFFLLFSPAVLVARTIAAPAPQASFDHRATLSFKANPKLTGTAVHLVAPLHLSVTSVSLPQEFFSQDFAATTTQWSAVVYPPLSIGSYTMTLSSGGVVLDRGALVIGTQRPTIALDPSLRPWDVSDGHLMRFTITAGRVSISVAQLRFKVVPINALLDTLTLYGFTDTAYAQAIWTGSDGALATSTLNATSSVATLTIDPPLFLGAGQTDYFSLDGIITPTDDSYSVITSIPNDLRVDVGERLSDLQATSNFVWSPNDFDRTSSTDEDWTNGWLLPELLYGLSIERYAQPVLACSLDVNTTTIEAPTSVTLTWSSSWADRALWSDGNVAPLQGSKTVVASSTSTYMLTFFSSRLGSTQCSATVTMDAQTVAATTTATTTPPVGNFTATPTSGAASLAVAIRGSINNNNACAATTYTFGYGDNSTTTINVPANSCKAQMLSLNHTYSAVGTYTERLYLGAFVKGSTTTPVLLQSQQITVTKRVAFAGIPLVANALFALQNTGSSLWAWFERLLPGAF